MLWLTHAAAEVMQGDIHVLQLQAACFESSREGRVQVGHTHMHTCTQAAGIGLPAAATGIHAGSTTQLQHITPAQLCSRAHENSTHPGRSAPPAGGLTCTGRWTKGELVRLPELLSLSL